MTSNSKVEMTDGDSKPALVVLTAKSPVGTKLITIVEIAKREIGAQAGKWFQYCAVGESLQVQAPIEARNGKSKGKGGNREGNDEGSEEEEEAFEEMKTPFERAIEGKEKVRTVPLLTIYLARVRVEGLRRIYGLVFPLAVDLKSLADWYTESRRMLSRNRNNERRYFVKVAAREAASGGCRFTVFCFINDTHSVLSKISKRFNSKYYATYMLHILPVSAFHNYTSLKPERRSSQSGPAAGPFEAASFIYSQNYVFCAPGRPFPNASSHGRSSSTATQSWPLQPQIKTRPRTWVQVYRRTQPVP